MGCDRRRAWAQKVILVLGHPKIINDSMGNVIKTLRFLGFQILHQMGPHRTFYLEMLHFHVPPNLYKLFYYVV